MPITRKERNELYDRLIQKLEQYRQVLDRHTCRTNPCQKYKEIIDKQKRIIETMNRLVTCNEHNSNIIWKILEEYL